MESVILIIIEDNNNPKGPVKHHVCRDTLEALNYLVSTYKAVELVNGDKKMGVFGFSCKDENVDHFVVLEKKTLV